MCYPQQKKEKRRMASNGLVVPELPDDKVRAFLRWVNDTRYPKRRFIFERKDVTKLAQYVTQLVRMMADRAAVDRSGVVTSAAISHVFEQWCVDSGVRIPALEAFRETHPG